MWTWKIKNMSTIQTVEECKDELPSKSTGMHWKQKSHSCVAKNGKMDHTELKHKVKTY